MTTDTALGRIEISPMAIATIAANAVTEAYGVVGLASKSAAENLLGQITGDVHRGA